MNEHQYIIATWGRGPSLGFTADELQWEQPAPFPSD